MKGAAARLQTGFLQLFDDVAADAPDRVAVVCGRHTLTYSELCGRANALAARLQAAGVGSDRVVGVCLPRRPSTLVGILGILKAGGAYLPVDPTHPVERRRYMLENAGAVAVLGDRALAQDLAGLPIQVLLPETEAAGESVRPLPGPRPEQLAYVMYTSGSTGQPKGVMIEHRSLHAFVSWALETFSSEELSTVLASTSLGFDISIFEVLVPLCSGGRVVLVDSLFEIERAARTEISLINTVPSVMAAVLGDRPLPASVRTVVLAGEPLSPALVAHVHEQPGVDRVVNAYGPTEDTIYSTWTDVEPDQPVAIGSSLPGSTAYVLDEGGKPVPPGEVGELHLGGKGLARGYINRDDLTRERFVAPTDAAITEPRLYRTGDLAKWEDGVLHHLGRVDDQIKIRGVRIEPGEVEGALSSDPRVRRAAVMVRPGPAGERNLIGYVLPAAGIELSGREIRTFVRGILPDPMVPSVIVPVTDFPLTPNGKLDRKRLPDPYAAASAAELRSETERRLAEIWRRVLRLTRPPGPQDDFFELGGDSLVAFELMESIAETLGVELPTHALAETSTLESLAREVEAGGEGVARVVKLQKDGDRVPCVYLGAGGMFSLRAFASAAGSAQPFLGLAVERASVRGQVPSVVETAEECLALLREEQPAGPYLLSGHSVGGHIAFEMACRLEALGERVELLMLLDPAAPHTLRPVGRVLARGRELVAMRSRTGRRRMLEVALTAARRVSARSNATTAEPDQDADTEEWIRGLGRLERDYRPGRLGADVVLFRTHETVRYTGSDTLGWDRYVAGELEALDVPGGHLSMLLEPHMQMLAREVASRIERVQVRLS